MHLIMVLLSQCQLPALTESMASWFFESSGPYLFFHLCGSPNLWSRLQVCYKTPPFFWFLNPSGLNCSWISWSDILLGFIFIFILNSGISLTKRCRDWIQFSSWLPLIWISGFVILYSIIMIQEEIWEISCCKHISLNTTYILIYRIRESSQLEETCALMISMIVVVKLWIHGAITT